MRASFALLSMIVLTSVALAEPKPQDNQTVTVGPWSIATNYKTDKFENCKISRVARKASLELPFCALRTDCWCSWTRRNGN